jgi:hypothetical protein
MTGWLRLRIMCPCGVTCLPPCGATCLPANAALIKSQNVILDVHLQTYSFLLQKKKGNKS